MTEEYKAMLEEKKEKLWAFFNDKDYNPMKVSDIAFLLGVPSEDMPLLEEAVVSLEKEGKILFTKKGKIATAESMQLYNGTFTGNERGFGFVRVEGFESDIFIPASAKNGAMHKDTVQVRITGSGKRPEGEVVKIIERGFKTIIGTYTASKNGSGFVIPDEHKTGYDIYIPSGASLGAVDGHKVAVKITKPATDKYSPEGKVVEILGHINDPGVDILSVIRQYEIPLEFPSDVTAQLEHIPDSVEDRTGRADYTNLPTVTIDGEDAKDLDDAVSVEKLENGNYRMSVFIADVSHYVTEGSPLDKEALKRGTSVYLVDRVIPMLPHKLSNGICSLNQGEDRFSLCCIMEIDQSGNVVDSEIQKAVINVNRRMSYTVVNDLLTNENSVYKEEYEPLLPMFLQMKELRDILLQKRRNRGAIEFEFDEAQIILDQNGKPIDIIKRPRNVATSIIEEFMLAANETVAERFFWLDIPFVYRTHEAPDEEKIASLKEVLAKFGYFIKGNSEHPKAFQQLLDLLEGKPEEMLLQRLILRSFKRARYTASNGMHFGLAAQYYCHFTSPIRRYPDLQIHRIISRFLDGTLNEGAIEHYKKILEDVASKCSANERRADDAENDTDKYKIAEYMEERIGNEYVGIISSVTSWGIYVELENTAEGMVSLSSLTDDKYIFDEKTLSVIGERSHKTYTVGDKLKIKVVRASRIARIIDFEIIEKIEKNQEK